MPDPEYLNSPIEATGKMTAPLRDVETDVVFVGQTGVGKSTLINMIMGEQVARVWNNAKPCTLQTTSYPVSLGSGLRCLLWDTRGLDEAAEIQGIMARLKDNIRQWMSSQARGLKETLRSRIDVAKPILIWCIHATKVDVDVHWQQFYKVFVEYCDRKATPMVVITQGPSKLGWEERCADQLQKLGLGVDVPVKMVRKYKSVTSPEYREDSEVLKNLIESKITSP